MTTRASPLRVPASSSRNRCISWQSALALLAILTVQGCTVFSGPDGTMRPQTVVLFATPKMLPDFANPDVGVAQFLDHYEPLIARAAETIVIFSVGNSDHILNYGGTDKWDENVE